MRSTEVRGVPFETAFFAFLKPTKMTNPQNYHNPTRERGTHEGRRRKRRKSIPRSRFGLGTTRKGASLAMVSAVSSQEAKEFFGEIAFDGLAGVWGCPVRFRPSFLFADGV